MKSIPDAVRFESPQLQYYVQSEICVGKKSKLRSSRKRIWKVKAGEEHLGMDVSMMVQKRECRELKSRKISS